MVDILHRVGIKASSEEVYKALATRDGLAGWWTTNTQGDSKLGGVIKFRFSADGREIGGFDVKVLELRPAERVLWQVSRGARGVDRHQGELRAETGRRLFDRAFQARGLEGTGGVHAPLLHEVGDLPDEPEGAGRDGQRGAQPGRRPDQQLALSNR